MTLPFEGHFVSLSPFESKNFRHVLGFDCCCLIDVVQFVHGTVKLE